MQKLKRLKNLITGIYNSPFKQRKMKLKSVAKHELAKRICNQLGNRSPTVIEINHQINVINITQKLIKLDVKNGKKITWVGFGTFYPKKQIGCIRRNISKGKAIFAPEKMVAKFKVSPKFIEYLNN